MSDKNLLKTITKLNRDTKEGTVLWDSDRRAPSSLSGGDNLLGNMYSTRVLGKNIRLYKYEYKDYYEEESFHWSTRFRLELVDHWGATTFIFPEDTSIYDLYNSVMYQTSNVKDFLDSYLTDEDKKEGEPLF